MSSELTLVTKPSPFRQQRNVVKVAAGQTISELVSAVKDGANWPDDWVYVAVDDETIPLERWGTVSPKPGSLVSVVLVPGRNRQEAVRLGLTLAIVAAGIAAPYALTGLGATGLVAAGGGLTLTGSLVSAGVTVGGGLLLNTMMPTAGLDNQRASAGASTTYSLTGAQNTLRPNSPVPVVLGKHRITPALGSGTWTEPVGDEQYLHILLVWCHGPALIEDIKIGNTSIDDFDEVEIEHRAGYASDTNLELFPRVINELQLSILIKKSDGWIVRTTDENVTRISGDLIFLQGLLRVSKNQKNQDPMTVVLEIATSPAGEDDWTLQKTLTVKGETADSIRSGFKFNVTAGKYDVRIRRVTDDIPDEDQDRIFDRVHWLALRWLIPEDPVRMRKVAHTAIRIRASNQLNGVTEAITGLATGLYLDWDGDSSWVAEQATRNPASLFRAVLQHKARRKPAPTSRIDLATLQDWHEECAANGWTFDGVIDVRVGVFEVLEQICACGYARPTRIDGKWTVTRDRPKTNSSPVAIITPRNSKDFVATREWPPVVHAFQVSYVNADQDYELDTVTVYDDDYDASNATEIEEINAPFGMTTHDEVWRWGRRWIAERRLRPRRYQVELDWEYLLLNAGDLVLVQHDVTFWGIGAGRITAITLNGGGTSVVSITLDEPQVLATDNYGLRIAYNDGSLPLLAITDASTVTDTFTLSTPLAVASAPEIGNLVSVGTLAADSRRCIVNRIEPLGPELNARLLLVDEAPEIHDAPFSDIPDYDPGITPPPSLTALVAPAIENIRSDESVMPWVPATGAYAPVMVITLRLSIVRSYLRIRYVVVYYRVADSGQQWTSKYFNPEGDSVTVEGVIARKIYELKLCYIYEPTVAGGGLRRGPFLGPLRHLVVGATTPPPTPSPIFVDGDWLRWNDDDVAIDHAGWKMRWSATTNTPWDYALSTHGGLLIKPRIHREDLPHTAVEVLLKAVDRSNLLSLEEQRYNLREIDDDIRYVLDTVDFKENGFPGTITGGSIDEETGYLIADTTTAYLPDPSVPYLPDPDEPYLEAEYAQVTYLASYAIPPNARTSDRIVSEISVTGNWTQEVRWQGDAVLYLEVGDQWLSNDAEAQMLADDASAPFFGNLGETNRPWIPWLGKVVVVVGETLLIRLTSQGGLTQAQINAFTLTMDARERTVRQTVNFVAGDTGTKVIPNTAAPYRQLVQVVPVAYEGEIAYFRRFKVNPESDAINGALMRAYKINGQRASGEAVVTLYGC